MSCGSLALDSPTTKIRSLVCPRPVILCLVLNLPIAQPLVLIVCGLWLFLLGPVPDCLVYTQWSVQQTATHVYWLVNNPPLRSQRRSIDSFYHCSCVCRFAPCRAIKPSFFMVGTSPLYLLLPPACSRDDRRETRSNELALPRIARIPARLYHHFNDLR
jgi:hypothetical protein